MEKRGEGKEGIPVLALAKCLLVSYVLTLLLLCLLALLLYKLHLTEGIVTIAISAIYVVTTFTAGFLAGKRMEKQKFLWRTRYSTVSERPAACLRQRQTGRE